MKSDSLLLRTLARQHPQYSLYGTSPYQQSLVDQWLDASVDNISLENINSTLSSSKFITGQSLTIADISLHSHIKTLNIQNSNFPHINNWLISLPTIDTFNTAISLFTPTAQSKPQSIPQQSTIDIPLHDAKHGHVVTRFPPEPSGYLHIGHAKAALLNDYFARLYNGKLLIRFDDTNPSKEKMEYENSIKEDLVLLGIHGDKFSHTSDHFPIIYDYAIQMIKMGKAYVDDTDQETMRAQRFDGIDSKCRNSSVDENLQLFQHMKDATEIGLKSCLRAKIDMQDKNKAMRDPVIYRCNLIPHPHTGTTWKMYPTYDFVCPIVDSLEGVTHALRTNEYRDRNPQYEWFLNVLNLRKVHIWDYSRLNFVYTLLSKRKLTWFVEEGLVTGWDDPRFATVRGIRRRGMTIEALRSYIIMQGASQRELSLEWDKLWALNKKIIDPVAPRHTALEKDKLVTVKILDSFSPYEKQVLKHKKNPDVGNKTTVYSNNLFIEFQDAKDLVAEEEITFMEWGNVIIKSVEWNAQHTEIEQIQAVLHLEGDFKKTKKKLTWLSCPVPSFSKPELNPVEILLLDYDYLITKKKLEENDELKDFITPVTEFKTLAIGDSNLRMLKKGDIIQFERKGYYICDVPFVSADSGPINLIYIPDGKVASTVSKATDSNVKQAPSKKEKKQTSEKKSKGDKSKAVKQDSKIGIMYPVKSIYETQGKVVVKNISGMYEMKCVYGPEELASASASDNISSKTVKNEEEKTLDKNESKSKKAKSENPKPSAAPVSDVSMISKLDIVVGRIKSVKLHPDADTLYIEEIECGEAEPRIVVSGLVKFMKPEEMENKTILILKNLKPASMRGVKSHAMVLCASNATHDKVEFLVPPEGSKPGDRVFFKGHEGEPEALLNPKKKVWETIQPDFTTREDLVATWKGIAWETSKGLVRTASIAKASIK